MSLLLTSREYYQRQYFRNKYEKCLPNPSLNVTHISSKMTSKTKGKISPFKNLKITLIMRIVKSHAFICRNLILLKKDSEFSSAFVSVFFHTSSVKHRQTANAQEFLPSTPVSPH